MDELLDTIIPFLKSNILIVGLAMIGLVLLGFGIWQIGGVDAKKMEIEEVSIEDVKGQTTSREIVVDIQGAVKKPGVYTLSEDQRLNSVISLAGGLTKDADTHYIAKNINLASRVQDGMKIYLPFEGEKLEARSDSGAIGVGSVDQASGLMNINSASESELDALPGIGPATAAKIISLRPFTAVEELLSKKAVGEAVFAKIKDKVTAP